MQLLIVGKSTFLKIMDKFPGVKVFPEPVESWQKVWMTCLLMRLAILCRLEVRTCWMTCLQILAGGQLPSSYTPHLPGRFALLPYKDKIKNSIFLIIHISFNWNDFQNWDRPGIKGLNLSCYNLGEKPLQWEILLCSGTESRDWAVDFGNPGPKVEADTTTVSISVLMLRLRL